MSYQIILTKTHNLTFQFSSSNYNLNEKEFVRASGLDTWQEYTLNGGDYNVKTITFGYKYSNGTKWIKAFANPFFGYGRMLTDKLMATGTTRNEMLVAERSESDPAGNLAIGLNFGVDFLLDDYVVLSFESGIVSSGFEVESEFNSNNPNFSLAYEKFRLPYYVYNVGFSIGINF